MRRLILDADRPAQPNEADGSRYAWAGMGNTWAMKHWVLSVVAVSTGCYNGLQLGDASELDESIGSSAGEAGGSDGEDDADTDGDGETPPQAACAEPAVGLQPLRRLTRDQYTRTVRDLLGIDTDVADGFPTDERLGAFESNAIAPISNLGVEQYMAAAETLAADAMALHHDELVGCDPVTMGQEPCAEAFIRDLGKRAHRRPLSEDEVQMYLGLFQGARDGSDFDAALQLVLQTMLQSPHFLYHVEVGGQSDSPSEEIVAVDGYALASRLSYYLWGTMPDEALFAAAESGALAEADGLEAQAERLLADPRAAETIASFHLQWLHVDDMTAVDKDQELFPDFDEGLKAAMQQEVADFASYVIQEGDGNLRTLMSGSFTVSDDPQLLALYGVERPVGHQSGEPIELDPAQRAGLLTQPALLAKAAHTDQSSPVHRGVVVRENFLCQPLPTPPDDVDDTPPDPDPNATTRERFAEHTSDPACAACHVLIDGLGFGFENYDAVGAFRTMEGDLPVDASGEVVATADIDGPFDGAVELAGMLASSTNVQQCVSRQWLNFAIGRVVGDEDACSSDAVYAAFEASDLDVPSLILSVVSSDAFRYRRLEGGM